MSLHPSSSLSRRTSSTCMRAHSRAAAAVAPRRVFLLAIAGCSGQAPRTAGCRIKLVFIFRHTLITNTMPVRVSIFAFVWICKNSRGWGRCWHNFRVNMGTVARTYPALLAYILRIEPGDLVRVLVAPVVIASFATLLIVLRIRLAITPAAVECISIALAAIFSASPLRLRFSWCMSRRRCWRRRRRCRCWWRCRNRRRCRSVFDFHLETVILAYYVCFHVIQKVVHFEKSTFPRSCISVECLCISVQTLEFTFDDASIKVFTEWCDIRDLLVIILRPNDDLVPVGFTFAFFFCFRQRQNMIWIIAGFVHVRRVQG